MPSLPPGYPSRPDARGRARKRHQGKVYDFGEWGTPASLAAYREWLVSTLNTKPELPTDRLTISALIFAWLAYEHQERGERHREVIGITRALVPLEELYGATWADEFRVYRLREVQAAMVARGWSRQYVNKQIGRACRLFRWGEARDYVPPGTWHHLKSMEPIRANSRVRSTKPRSDLDWQKQVEPVLAAVSLQVAAMLRTIYLAGARPSEIRLMRTNEIERGEPKGCWTFRPAQHKNLHRGFDKAIVLGPQAQAILASFLLSSPFDDAFVFRSVRGVNRPYTSESLSQAVRRACKALGIQPWQPYDLRHLRRRDITRTHGLDAARAILGHTSAAMTSQYSRHADLQLAADALRECG